MKSATFFDERIQKIVLQKEKKQLQLLHRAGFRYRRSVFFIAQLECRSQQYNLRDRHKNMRKVAVIEPFVNDDRIVKNKDGYKQKNGIPQNDLAASIFGFEINVSVKTKNNNQEAIAHMIFHKFEMQGQCRINHHNDQL